MKFLYSHWILLEATLFPCLLLLFFYDLICRSHTYSDAWLLADILFRITNQLVEIDGLGKLTSLRYGHFGISLEALTACGVSLFYVYRFSLLPCDSLFIFNTYSVWIFFSMFILSLLPCDFLFVFLERIFFYFYLWHGAEFFFLF